MNETNVEVANLSVSFGKAEFYEEMLGRDLCNFSTNEIIEFYKIVNTPSLEYLIVLNSNFALYTDFCIGNGLVTDSQNHYREFSTENLLPYVNTSLLEKKILTREEVLNLAESAAAINPSEGFVILALFEGICGRACSELYDARLEQIEGNQMHLSSGRTVVISDELKALAVRSAETYHVQFYMKDGSTREAEYDQYDDGIIKKRKREGFSERTDAAVRQQITRRLNRALNYNGKNELSAKSLIMSGVIDYINRQLDENPNLEAKEVVVRSASAVRNQYQFDLNKVVARFLLKYKEFLNRT